VKLLISDYDGTIKTFDNNPNLFEKYIFNKNIKEINNFIKKNKFVIATGRNTESIYEETKKYKILYDYLISYNGRVIVDKYCNVLNAQYIDNNFLKELDGLNIKKLTLFDEYKKNNNSDNPVYIYLKLKDVNDMSDALREWEGKYPNLEISCMLHTIVIRKKYNKLKGISKLLELEKINVDTDDIITVGDGKNDMDMINYYYGYRMFFSNPELWTVTDKMTTSVHKLIKKIK